VFDQRPALRCASRLGDEVALRLIRDERLEEDRVGAPVGVEQEVVAVAVGDREVGSPRGLHDAVGDASPQGRDLHRGGVVLRQHGQDPADRLERQALRARLADERAGPPGVCVTHERPHAERVGLERPADVRPAVSGDVAPDVAEVAPRAVERLARNREALGSRPGEGVGRVDRDVGPRAVATAPEGEASVLVLHGPQALDVPLHRVLDVVGLRQALRLEGGEHVAERRHREDARGDLLGALEGIAHEVEHRVGQGLEGGRGRLYLEPSELREDAGRRLDGLDDRTRVDLAVGKEGLGGGWRPDRQLDHGRVGEGA
jgi:hypothetical protein